MFSQIFENNFFLIGSFVYGLLDFIDSRRDLKEIVFVHYSESLDIRYSPSIILVLF
jgi:hypothetical protein